MISVAVTGAAVKAAHAVDDEGVGSLLHLGAQLVQLCGDRFQAVALLQAASTMWVVSPARRAARTAKAGTKSGHWRTLRITVPVPSSWRA